MLKLESAPANCGPCMHGLQLKKGMKKPTTLLSTLPAHPSPSHLHSWRVPHHTDGQERGAAELVRVFSRAHTRSDMATLLSFWEDNAPRGVTKKAISYYNANADGAHGMCGRPLLSRPSPYTGGNAWEA